MVEDEITEKQLTDYLIKLKERDALFDIKVEFGKFLLRDIDSLTEEELVRYNELKQIITENKK